MSILQINTEFAGQAGVLPRLVRILSNDTLATITTAGYLNGAVAEGYQFLSSDFIFISYNGGAGIFAATFSNGIITLASAESTVVLPVVSGDFAVFSGTQGAIADLGYSPTNAAKTKVIMANGATVANHIMVSTDVNGTSGNLTGTAINDGSIQAGRDTVAGTLISFPSTTASGQLIVAAVNNSSGNFNTTISNASAVGQSQVISIPDSGSATANYILSKIASSPQHITVGGLQVDAGALISGLATGGFVGKLQLFPTTTTTGSLSWQATPNTGNTATVFTTAAYGQATTVTYPDPGVASANGVLAPAALVSGNIISASGTAGNIQDTGVAALNVSIMKVFTLTAGQLATAGKVNIQVHSSGTSQYFIQDVKVLTSTGLSGGGGNRLLAITDGTLVWNNAGITAALLGTPIFTLWSGTGNPIAVGTSQVSTAGADIYFQYTGGTTDYTTGSVQVAVTYVKVTA